MPDLSPLYQKWGLNGLFDLDAAVISHAHLDHAGALPFLTAELKEVPIYGSRMTPEIMSVQFLDLQKKSGDAEDLKRKEDCTCAADRMIPLPYGQTAVIGECRLTLYPAGHLMGAAMAYFESPGMNVLFTGDFADFDQHTVSGYRLPENLAVDVLIMESTNGYRGRVRDARVYNQQLTGRLNAELNAHGQFHYAPSSVGQAPEFVLAVKAARDEGSIANVPIWILPSAEADFNVCEHFGIRILGPGIGFAAAQKHGFRNREAAVYVGHWGPGSLRNPGKETSVNCLTCHADCNGMLELVSRVRPKKVLLIHGQPVFGNSRNIIEEIHECFGSLMTVQHVKNGVNYPLDGRKEKIGHE